MRAAALAAGAAVLALVWTSPLLRSEASSFSAHMIVHLAVVAVAAPLIALAIAGTRADPSSRLPMLFSPALASLVDLLVVWAWHAPALRALSEASALARAGEQASFLAAGLVLWLACIGYGERKGERSLAGASGLLLTSVHMTLLGALLALTPRPLYGDGAVTCLGFPLSADQDQQIGGVLMLLVGAAVYMAGGLALLARVLAEPVLRGARR